MTTSFQKQGNLSSVESDQFFDGNFWQFLPNSAIILAEQLAQGELNEQM